MSSQAIDMGLKRASLEIYLQAMGYWATPEMQRRNSYVLSPSAYAFSSAQQEDLTRLSVHTYAALKSLSARLSTLAHQRSASNDDMRFLSLATRNTRGLLGPLHIGGAVPPVVKVDLVQDRDGKYHIAEVDAYNPRGFGYFALLDGTVPSSLRSHDTSVLRLARLLRPTQAGQQWNIIVSNFERYYEPAFGVLVRALAEHDVSALIVREGDLSSLDIGKEKTAHVFCIPESLYDSAEMRDVLVGAYMSGAIKSFYPPAAYLGSKAFLPFISKQPGMQEFVPRCELVARRQDPREQLNGNTVLKGVMSSGLKKVIFSDTEQERFERSYQEGLSTKNPQWILQEQVTQEPTPVVVFDADGMRITQDYYLRITAYISADGLLGAEVTGRTDRAVHGAPDCIQIPAINA